MKNYQIFKETINKAIERVYSSTGVKLIAKKWTKESPYQKARYKPEYIFPEVWLYPSTGGMGIVINGEEVHTAEKLSEYLENLI